MTQRIRTGIAAAFGMIILILDTKTALIGANGGITLCITTVIPSLLPFIFISNLLTSALAGTSSRALRFFGRYMKMPPGSESLFIIGALGGYPTGANAVAAAYANGQLPKTDAQRLLGFCSNAGPSFLFGITALQFPNLSSVWLLWLIHLLSAFLTGMILPGRCTQTVQMQNTGTISAIESLRRSIRSVAQICGWIILFRILITFSDRWFLWLFHDDIKVLFSGTTELSIGCVTLSKIENQGVRFITAAAILGFGGVCVLMQTASAVGALGIGMYLPGKIIQCSISVLLASVVQHFLYDSVERCRISPYLLLAAFTTIIITTFLIQKKKKAVEIRHCLLYNSLIRY